MSIVASQLIAAVSVTGADTAEAKLTGVGAASEGAGGKLKMLALGGLAIAGAALIGIGVASVKMAGDFQSGLTSLVTGAGEAESNLKMVSDGILAMSVQTGTSTKDLIDGMYMIESAGFHGAAGLAVLQAAAEGAKVGAASLADVANGVTTAMVDYAKSHLSAADATNTLIAAVSLGKTHMQDLATSMSTILPTAAAVGVSFKDVAAAMATMTGEGTDAASAATYLRQLLLALEAPGSKAKSTLAEIGLTTGQVAAAMRESLPGALEMITYHLKQKFPEGSAAYVAALKDIAGGSKQMQGILELTGSHLKTFGDNVAGIYDAVAKGKGGITGWALVQQDFNFKMEQAKAAVEAIFIAIGTKLLPIVTPLVAKISSLLIPFASWIASGHGLSDAMSTLGTWIMTKVVPPIQKMMEVVGPLIADLIQGAIHSGAFQGALAMIVTVLPYLVTGFTNVVIFLARIAKWMFDNQAAFTAFKVIVMVLAGVALAVLIVGLALVAVTLGVVLLAVLLVAAPIIGIVLLIQHWGDIMHWFQGVWATVWGAISSFAVGVWNHLAGFFTTVWNGIVNGFKTSWNAVVSFIQGIWTHIVGIFQGAIQTVVGWFLWLYNHNYYFHNLVDNIRAIIQNVVNWLTSTWQHITGWIVAKWDWLKAMATLYWHMLLAIIQSKVQQVENFLHGIWTNIVNFLSEKWHNIVTNVQTMWSTISGFFSSAWNKYIAGPLGTLATNLGNFFGNLANTALQWGKNLIQGLIDGIMNMLGNLESTLGNVAGDVAKFLGFHSPTEKGPGRYADTWMPALMSMLAKGIEAGVPSIHAAVSMAVAPIARLGMVTPGGTGGSFVGVHTPYAFPSMQAAAPTIVIHVQSPDMVVDGHRLAGVLMPGIVRQIRSTTGVRF